MKRGLLMLINFVFLIPFLTAQRLVNPNRPSNLPGGSRLVAMAELQAGKGSAEESVPYSDRFLGINAMVGYQAGRSFMFGLGSGISFYDGGQLIPLFIDMRYTFNAQVIEPYLFADGGMMLDFTNPDESRIFINPGIGARYSVTMKTDVYAGAGMFLQSGNINQDLFINLKAGIAHRF